MPQDNLDSNPETLFDRYQNPTDIQQNQAYAEALGASAGNLVRGASASSGGGLSVSAGGWVSQDAGVVGGYGGGGGTGGEIGNQGNCPSVEMYVLIKKPGHHQIVGSGGWLFYLTDLFPIQVKHLKASDYLFNPVSSLFEKVKSHKLITDVLLRTVRTREGAQITASYSHPLITAQHDKNGVHLDKIKHRQTVWAWHGGEMEDAKVISSRKAGRGDVIHVETEGAGHIYLAGDSPDRMIAAHNLRAIKEL